MLRSMTGFGSATGEVESVGYAVEIRSVNNRYFKANIKLPENFSSVEGEIEKLLRKHLSRGTVTVTVRLKLPDEQAACRVNTVALESYIDQLKAMETDANPTMRIDLSALLLLPGVCEPQDIEELCHKTRQGLLEAIGGAIGQLVAMREQEGQEIAKDIEANCGVIEKHLAAVSRRTPDVVRSYHERLSARVVELTRAGNVKIDEENLAREVAIFAERSDIAEEVSRLGGHLQQFRQAIGAAEPAGRRLDFISQEMLREANTIASKANDQDIIRLVVEIKTAIDRIKEQVQNAE